MYPFKPTKHSFVRHTIPEFNHAKTNLAINSHRIQNPTKLEGQSEQEYCTQVANFDRW